MAIKFPGEIFPPTRPDLETIESFDNSVVGGVEKFASVSTTVVSLADVVAKAGDTMTGQLIINSGGLSMQSELFLNRTSVAADYLSARSDIYIGVTDTSAARAITLDSTDVENERILVVKDESGAAGTNNITIQTQGSETIDGAATNVISANHGVVRLISDGSNWFAW